MDAERIEDRLDVGSANGRIELGDSGAALLGNDRVRQAYLGL